MGASGPRVAERGGDGEKDGLQTYLRPLLWAALAHRAMMESAHGEPMDDTGPVGQACCRLFPVPVRPVSPSHRFAGQRTWVG
jgi:hypothetical protein